MKANKNRIFYRIVDGQSVEYIPKDKNGVQIFSGTTVIMPEPNDSDNYRHGGWVGTVEDIRDDSGNLIVIDQEGDFSEIEPARVEVQEA